MSRRGIFVASVAGTSAIAAATSTCNQTEAFDFIDTCRSRLHSCAPTSGTNLNAVCKCSCDVVDCQNRALTNTNCEYDSTIRAYANGRSYGLDSIARSSGCLAATERCAGPFVPSTSVVSVDQAMASHRTCDASLVHKQAEQCDAFFFSCLGDARPAKTSALHHRNHGSANARTVDSFDEAQDDALAGSCHCQLLDCLTAAWTGSGCLDQDSTKEQYIAKTLKQHLLFELSTGDNCFANYASPTSSDPTLNLIELNVLLLGAVPLADQKRPFLHKLDVVVAKNTGMPAVSAFTEPDITTDADIDESIPSGAMHVTLALSCVSDCYNRMSGIETMSIEAFGTDVFGGFGEIDGVHSFSLQYHRDAWRASPYSDRIYGGAAFPPTLTRFLWNIGILRSSSVILAGSLLAMFFIGLMATGLKTNLFIKFM